MRDSYAGQSLGTFASRDMRPPAAMAKSLAVREPAPQPTCAGCKRDGDRLPNDIPTECRAASRNGQALACEAILVTESAYYQHATSAIVHALPNGAPRPSAAAWRLLSPLRHAGIVTPHQMAERVGEPVETMRRQLGELRLARMIYCVVYRQRTYYSIHPFVIDEIPDYIQHLAQVAQAREMRGRNATWEAIAAALGIPSFRVRRLVSELPPTH
jgi:hypothetical protein